MNVLFAGGGTGGHVFPAIAVAEELSQRDRQTRFLFVGSNRGLEARVLPERGYAFEALEAGALKGLSLARQWATMVGLPRSIRDAARIVKRFSPQVVVGIGGYASAPALVAAWWQGRPAMILEQNSIPGLTNRLLSYFVSGAAVNFEESARFFPGNAVVTGNPVRREFFKIGPPREGDTFNILVFGGSQGAQAINQAVIDSLPWLEAQKETMYFIHQTGEKNLAWVRDVYTAQGWRADVRPFIEDMPQQIERAHLVIGRAGASTLSEIAAAGRASILIPLPTAADDHQRRNAEVFAHRQAALLMEQAILTGERLARAVQLLKAHPERREAMSRAAASLAVPDAASRIAEMVEALATKH